MKAWSAFQIFALAIALSLSPQPGRAQERSSEEVPPINVVGSISDVVKAVLPYWTSRHSVAISYRRYPETTAEAVLFEIYNSRYANSALYRDNCVSAGWEKVVDCDLKMVDDLIEEFRLLEIYASNGRRKAARDSYRRSILLWVLSHELGHIELEHGRSDYREDVRGLSVFDAAAQSKELQADQYSITVIGNIDKGSPEAYSTVLDITNSLIRKSVCPRTYPRLCRDMPSGVGLIYNYQSDAKPIRIRLLGAHPEFVARFLRILYLAAMGSSQESSLAVVSKQAIDLLEVEAHPGDWKSLKRVFARQ